VLKIGYHYPSVPLPKRVATTEIHKSLKLSLPGLVFVQNQSQPYLAVRNAVTQFPSKRRRVPRLVITMPNPPRAGLEGVRVLCGLLMPPLITGLLDVEVPRALGFARRSAVRPSRPHLILSHARVRFSRPRTHGALRAQLTASIACRPVPRQLLTNVHPRKRRILPPNPTTANVPALSSERNFGTGLSAIDLAGEERVAGNEFSRLPPPDTPSSKLTFC
jgi:hypothetical protein